MNLPAPRDQLFGCIWLPRIRAKARLFKAGELPADYVRAFCAEPGVDGHFLRQFQTDIDALLAACDLPDAEFEAWFRALPGNGEARITEWNAVAVNLGRPGYPMAERFAWALGEYYAHLANRGLQTVFEVLEADEGITSKS